jgi:hypothetical protein
MHEVWKPRKAMGVHGLSFYEDSNSITSGECECLSDLHPASWPSPSPVLTFFPAPSRCLRRSGPTVALWICIIAHAAGDTLLIVR